MTKDTLPKALGPITYDPHDPVLFGLQFGNAVWRAANAPLLSERTSPLPSRHPFSGLTIVKGDR